MSRCILRLRRKFTYPEARTVGASQILLTLSAPTGGGGQLERFYVVNHNVVRVQGGPLINRRRGVHDFQIQLSSPSVVRIANVQALYVNALSPPEP